MSKRGGNVTIDPMSGWPRTTQTTTASGEPCFDLNALVLSPERAKFGDALLVLLLIAGWVIILAPLFTGGPGADDPGPALGIWCAAILLLYVLRPWWLSRRLRIKMTPEHLRIGRKAYDRSLILQWIYEIHDRARDEEIKDMEAQQEATMEGKKPVRKGKYYRKSYQLMMNYAGQRVDIASIYGRERLAAGLRDRLEQMDGIMDKVQAFGSPAQEAGEHYGERPGID
jgi:hypothetical protein